MRADAARASKLGWDLDDLISRRNREKSEGITSKAWTLRSELSQTKSTVKIARIDREVREDRDGNLLNFV